jgi:internalin A
LQDRHIGTEHLFLGLLREERSMAAEILYESGLRIQAVREEIRRNQALEVEHSSSRAFDPKATEVNLAHHRLAEVPEGIRKLKQLRKLDLADNNLVELPEFLGHLTHLEYLDASNNDLIALPDSLLSLKSLETLYLHDNPSLGIPAEILGPHPASNAPLSSEPNRILEYYYRVRSSRQSLNEAKLILVGRGAVGKTSIVNRLLYDVFRREKKTDGIQITKWNLRLNRDELVRLNIWDFGGQEILHATHQFFLTCRSLYLLVLTGREGSEDADAEYWLKLIESFGEEAPVIVVLNKSKEFPFDVNRRALIQKYPNIKSFIRTDCKDRTGLKELRRAIEKETNLLEHLRIAFPENWFAIKERLALMKTNYLSFNEYREQCAIFGEKDASAQEALSYYLHNLGIALNYRDDPRLQDTYVLNPHWVTNGIYSILSSERLKENRGEIHLKDLSEILPTQNYPVKMHRFLMDLMKKFELCFTFPDDDCHFLVPELLDKQEPLEGSSFKPLECLNFQYHYPVLHEGLLPRFIVRTHVLSEGYPRWRSGVVLNFEGNLALVRADLQEKRVFIFVSGPPSGRRRLLAIIRADFEHIHSEIRTLRPYGMVALPEYPDVLIPYEKLLAMESSGIDVLPELANGKVIEVSVNALLNGVDLEGARIREILMNEPLSAIHLLCCYSRKDERLREELDTHLKLMHRQGLITTWNDRNIDGGEDWKLSIDDNLEKAHIILLLVSADFIASDYCYATEMKRALKRHKDGAAVLIPIIVRDVNLSIAPFDGIQCLPKDGKPITLWDDRDSAWRSVSEGIQRVVEKLLKKKAGLE